MNKSLSRTSFDELIQAAERLWHSGTGEQAVALYRDWIRHNPKSPVLFAAHFNLGYNLSNLGQFEEALTAYQTSLRYKSNFFHAQLNAGVMLEKFGRLDEAAAMWRAATKNEQQAGGVDNLLLAYNNLGRLLDATKQWPEALQVLARSLELQPTQDKVLYHWIRLRQRICAWPIYAALPHISAESMVAQNSAIAMLSISDDPALQRQAAQHNVNISFKADPLPARLSPVGGYKHQRLRIGYLSSNFNFHPVSLIAVELFELHDRSRFEVFGFSWSPEDGSPMLARVRQAMDHFIPIHALSDAQAAQLIASHEIDILIDLQGLTTGARAGILIHRPAPFQINYLGHPGTTCVPGVDYILADRYVIPGDERPHYSEEVLYLPDCLQTSDSKRPRPVIPKSERSRYGLPDNAFVFCSFNNTNKFTPETFACWMRILQRVPGSVLWLLADNPTAEANLRQYARDQGIDTARLVFAGRVDYSDFLARFGMADLFLDTFPCTGGTTINDALWMDVPIVTRAGRSFASRLSGSILNALGLNDYVTDSFSAYEELAVRLAQQPELLHAYQQRLIGNKVAHPLFDMPRLVHQIEDTFEQLARPELAPAGKPSLVPDAAPNGSTESANKPRVSVVVVAHEHADWLEHVIPAIRQQADNGVQLIVVSGILDSVRQQRVTALLQGQDIHLQQCGVSDPTMHREMGQRIAGSTDIVFLDGGADLTPAFLSSLRGHSQ